MVNYEGDTPTPPLVNYRQTGPSASAIYLRTDSKTEQELRRLAEDPSSLKEKSLFLNRNDEDGNKSTNNVDHGKDRIYGGALVTDGELPMMASLISVFSDTRAL